MRGSLIKRYPYNCKRLASGSFDDAGEWVPGGVDTNFIIRATAQPMKANEMQTLPEGRRERQSYVLYTDTRLNTVLENDGDPDIVTIGNNDYEVYKRFNWANNIINHYKYGVVRLTTK